MRWKPWSSARSSDTAPGGGMILAPTAGPYAANLTERQQENTSASSRPA